MNNRIRDEDHSERGAAIVEFALVLPLLMALVFGIVTSGSALNDKQSLTHAAREGARYGARLPTDQVFTDGSWAANVRDITVERSGGDINIDEDSTVCVSLVHGSPATTFSGPHPAGWYSTNTDATPCDPTETYEVTENDDGLRVQVVVSHPVAIQAIFFSRSLEIGSSATMQSEFPS
jgi:Flp pilus assembly protein TadG